MLRMCRGLCPPSSGVFPSPTLDSAVPGWSLVLAQGKQRCSAQAGQWDVVPQYPSNEICGDSAIFHFSWSRSLVRDNKLELKEMFSSRQVARFMSLYLECVQGLCPCELLFLPVCLLRDLNMLNWMLLLLWGVSQWSLVKASGKIEVEKRIQLQESQLPLTGGYLRAVDASFTSLFQVYP